ncbi:MAG: lipid-binding SYLF domain-containing protein [Bryobacteraceae bacterium]|jgi:lipid-binding SYLF domain-containing protein
MKSLFLSALLAAPMFVAPMVKADDRTEDVAKRIRESGAVLGEIMNAGDKGIPEDLLQHAQCVGIIPNLKRAGFVVGAKYGKGVLTCRTGDGTGWSGPSTVIVEGGSIGFQIGLGETDLIFIVKDRGGMGSLEKDKMTFGGDASAMAGPVGRSTTAETDAMMHAEILSWSRSRGVFAGVSLEGATLRPDHADNERVYGHHVSQREILRGELPAPGIAGPLYDTLNRWAPYKKGE